MGEENPQTDGMRLNKFLAESGVASRRGSDRLVEEGRVTIDGKVAVLGDKVFPSNSVCVDGNPVKREEEDIILIFYKPAGITCTSNPQDEDNVIDYIGYPKRIYSIGRLDKDSEGLLLMTNNGELADKVMRSRYEHEKEYLVTVDRDVTGEFIKDMSNGVTLADGVVTKKCFVETIGQREFRIILKQGLNRQIRRMCAVFGFTVVRLKRVRVMNILLGDMKEGRYRNITKAERKELFTLLEEEPGSEFEI
ncbi:MAG: pseudouridine synthase [Candidatus Methanoplasma sp.]|jgi:23S rRNA pseudouridine2604 synthase|nr:pseudouridine synthase [Candidatus Methanoplasma sp.]